MLYRMNAINVYYIDNKKSSHVINNIAQFLLARPSLHRVLDLHLSQQFSRQLFLQ
jgi:hypothetical protein